MTFGSLIFLITNTCNLKYVESRSTWVFYKVGQTQLTQITQPGFNLDSMIDKICLGIDLVETSEPPSSGMAVVVPS